MEGRRHGPAGIPGGRYQDLSAAGLAARRSRAKRRRQEPRAEVFECGRRAMKQLQHLHSARHRRVAPASAGKLKASRCDGGQLGRQRIACDKRSQHLDAPVRASSSAPELRRQVAGQSVGTYRPPSAARP